MDQRRVTPEDLAHLNGQSVLVRSTADHRDPPVGRRGTIDARPGRDGTPEVKIVLEYPDMNNRAAHDEVIPLDAAGIARLCGGERGGVFEYTLDRPLDQGPEPGGLSPAQ